MCQTIFWSINAAPTFAVALSTLFKQVILFKQISYKSSSHIVNIDSTFLKHDVVMTSCYFPLNIPTWIFRDRMQRLLRLSENFKSRHSGDILGDLISNNRGKALLVLISCNWFSCLNKSMPIFLHSNRSFTVGSSLDLNLESSNVWMEY